MSEQPKLKGGLINVQEFVMQDIDCETGVMQTDDRKMTSGDLLPSDPNGPSVPDKNGKWVTPKDGEE